MFVLNYYSLPEHTSKSFVCSRNNFYNALKKTDRDTTEFSFWGNYIFVDLHKEVDIKKRER